MLEEILRHCPHGDVLEFRVLCLQRKQTALCLGFPPGILRLTVRQTVKTNLTGEEKFEMRMA